MAQLFQTDATAADFRGAIGVPAVHVGMKVDGARLTAELRRALRSS
ncbi:hypothetical protein OHA72_52860 [Dactylosporangium sp. NBC_01737]|nr:hypothetical protein OHA72_52860 [Dactylosporangium sp. NBC_01737]